MCDTFVILPPKTENGSVIFGKNSDREPNEMQVLEFHPRKQHAVQAEVECTYIRIPQKKETYAIYIGRPYWMWGAEFGVNEHGLAIGNEAVWTKMPTRKKGGLTGMDLLRLTLERAKTAEEGVEAIISLLADYGQGGICGLYDQSMAYHNSFILADPKEAWVLETADHLWVFFAASAPFNLGPISSCFNPDSFWWVHEILHREILKDFSQRKALIDEERKAFQNMLINKIETFEVDQWQGLSNSSFEGHWHIMLEWMEAVCAQPVKAKPSFFYRNYWKGMNKKVGLR